MSKINVEPELLDNHTDEEIIEYLDGLMTGVLKNYKTSLKFGHPEILWGNLGDISLVFNIIREIKKRNIARHEQISKNV